MSLLALLVALAGAPVLAQYGGPNHVVIKDFPWKVRSTEHFDIYYYDESKPLVPRTAEILERAFSQGVKALDIETEPPVWASEGAKKHGRWQRRPFFLYASPNDFQQSNIAQVGDGTGGVTEPFKNRFMVYNNGEAQWLDEVITHEFTHILQYHVLISGFWRSGQILKSIVYPLWFIEGMADFVTQDNEGSIEESLVRDAATSGGLLPLTRLEHFGHLKPHQISLAYHEGAVAMRFMAEQYGMRKVGDMLKLFETRLETSRVLMDLLGLDAFAFDRKFQEYAKTRYARVVRVNRLQEPQAFGGELTFTKDNIPQFNSSPVFSPDGRTMYYLTSKRDGDPVQVWELDLRTGRTKALPRVAYGRIENLPMGNFANISRQLAISPDGRWLAWGATKNHSDSLFLYDLKELRMDKVPLPGFASAQQPAFSPDGRTIAFSGMKDSTTDLYAYDRTTGAVRQLTNDVNDDQMPCFLPDGSLIYSQEQTDPLDAHSYERRLVRLDFRTGASKELESSGAQARDPMVSADGKTVLFAIDDGQFSDVYELTLATGKVARLTRTIGGGYAPAYAADGKIAFSSLRKGNLHIYLGDRSEFLSEDVPPAARALPAAAKFLLPGMGGVGVSSSTVSLTVERPYKASYSTDLFIPAFFYSSAGGFFWTSYWQGSDLLGNHQQAAVVQLHSGKDFDYQATYNYGRFRPGLVAQVSGSGRSQLIDGGTGDTIEDAYHQQSVGVVYPFDRYHRVEAHLVSASERLHDETTGSRSSNEARLASVALVRDTVTGRYLVAEKGNRLRLSWAQATEVLGGNRRFYLGGAEAQQFVRLGSQNSLALRAYGAQTLGPDHPQLIIGASCIYGCNGVRGYRRSVENSGSRELVGTAEWRFPIFPDLNYYMWYFFPDFYFKAVFGSLFTDTGLAWTTQGQFQHQSWSGVRNSIGVGLHIHTFILQEFVLPLSFVWAQSTTQNDGIFYFYLGQSF